MSELDDILADGPEDHGTFVVGWPDSTVPAEEDGPATADVVVSIGVNVNGVDKAFTIDAGTDAHRDAHRDASHVQLTRSLLGAVRSDADKWISGLADTSRNEARNEARHRIRENYRTLVAAADRSGRVSWRHRFGAWLLGGAVPAPNPFADLPTSPEWVPPSGTTVVDVTVKGPGIDVAVQQSASTDGSVFEAASALVWAACLEARNQLNR
jgi:hypothetical protein